jgi:hypothetical protein
MPGIVLSSSPAGDAEGLAGVSPVEDIDGADAGVELMDISDDRDSRVMGDEDFLAGSVELAEEGGLESEGELHAEIKSCNAREERSDSEGPLIGHTVHEPVFCFGSPTGGHSQTERLSIDLAPTRRGSFTFVRMDESSRPSPSDL